MMTMTKPTLTRHLGETDEDPAGYWRVSIQGPGLSLVRWCQGPRARVQALADAWASLLEETTIALEKAQRIVLGTETSGGRG